MSFNTRLGMFVCIGCTMSCVLTISPLKIDRVTKLSQLQTCLQVLNTQKPPPEDLRQELVLKKVEEDSTGCGKGHNTIGTDFATVGWNPNSSVLNQLLV